LWINTTAGDLRAFGETQIVVADAELTISHDGVLVFLVDSTSVSYVETTVARLRRKYSAALILVITASPTWQRARSAFESGASDYLSKSLTTHDLLVVIGKLLKRTHGYILPNVDLAKELQCPAKTPDFQLSR
jgi:DNA-binding response OmpR family regulator